MSSQRTEEVAPGAARPVILAVGGFDPSGAGLQADIETVASLNGHCCPIATCITVQNSRGVSEIDIPASDIVAGQIYAALEDFPIAAVKVGLLPSIPILEAVVDVVASVPAPLVVDPVLVAGSGNPLTSEDTTQLLRKSLLPKATLVTPNHRELARLGEDDSRQAALRNVLNGGVRYVLLTGGDEDTEEVENTLYTLQQEPVAYRWPRINGEYHGTGCTLASAIATFLARGLAVNKAVNEAQRYVHRALQDALRYDGIQHLPNRFTSRKNDE